MPNSAGSDQAERRGETADRASQTRFLTGSKVP